jgi:hypothetical protein
MDTMTYASVAMLPKSIAEEHAHFVRQDLELLPLDLSMIKRYRPEADISEVAACSGGKSIPPEKSSRPAGSLRPIAKDLKR